MKKETANGITQNIIRVINYTPGCVAYRINNVGVWDAAKGIHRAGNTEKGLPDIWACVRGKFLTIEVKAGSDRMSEEQKKRRFEIERAGGEYFEARSTDAFLQFWENRYLEESRTKEIRQMSVSEFNVILNESAKKKRT
jgi:hypothetical protein